MPKWEEWIREIVRDELELLEKKKQLKCDHARSGTLNEDSDLTCDDCGKLLDEDDGPTPDARGGMYPGRKV